MFVPALLLLESSCQLTDKQKCFFLKWWRPSKSVKVEYDFSLVPLSQISLIGFSSVCIFNSLLLSKNIFPEDFMFHDFLSKEQTSEMIITNLILISNLLTASLPVTHFTVWNTKAVKKVNSKTIYTWPLEDRTGSYFISHQITELQHRKMALFVLTKTFR